MKKILKNKKGFTLMELIIVLVIVAVLAAALLPSFLNFASRARNDSLHAQARIGLVTAQVLLTESGKPISGLSADTTYTTESDFLTAVGLPTTSTAFKEMVIGDVDNPTGFTKFIVEENGMRVIGITYTLANGDTVTIAPTPPASPTTGP